MKPRIFNIFLLLIFLVFTLTSCVPAASTPSEAALLSAQATPQPGEDQSVIGSTDGILALGFLIVAITSVPFLLRKNKK